MESEFSAFYFFYREATPIMFTVSSCFMWNFKLGDNINHNLDVIKLLYNYFEGADADRRRLLCKPIILILVSIIEAILHDFHDRIQNTKREHIANVTKAVANYVRGKKIDELEKYIASAKKHKFFGLEDTNFYDRLQELRKIRNRIHIQNISNPLETDERGAFNEKRKKIAERVLEKTMKTMAEKFPRAKQYNYVRDFSLPWNPYFANVSVS
jgi:hypothetical protein